MTTILTISDNVKNYPNQNPLYRKFSLEVSHFQRDGNLKCHLVYSRLYDTHRINTHI